MAKRDTDEDLWKRRLWHRLQLIEALESHLDGRHWGLAAGGSDLAMDDAQAYPFQTSHLVAHCLSSGLDCLRSTRILLTDPSVDAGLRIPLIGHYPAIRSAMESGAEAPWLLGPEESQLRVVRTLQARWDDIVDDDQAILAMTDSDAGDQKADVVRKQKMRRENSKNVRAKKRRLRTVAANAKVPESVMFEGLPGFGEMLRETAKFTRVESNHQAGMWRLVSGLSHPSASRALMLSVVDEVDEERGIVNAELTASISMTSSAIDAALLLHFHALDLAATRGNRPDVAFRLPDGVPLPPGYEHLATFLGR
ncbi:MAG TPA: hypothetical protein VF479_07685 [Pseudolysinimonas sp.]